MGRAVPDAALAAMPFTGDQWRIVAEGAAALLAHAPSVFAIGNGFIGMRGPEKGSGASDIYLNGVFETMPIAYHEAAHGYAANSDTRLPVADATRIDIAIGDVPAGDFTRVELDFRRGVRIETIEAKGCAIRIERLVSMERRGIVASRVEIHAANGATRVAVRSSVSPPPLAGGSSDNDAPYDPRVGPAFGNNPWEVIDEIAAGEIIGRVDRLRCTGFAVAALASGGETVELASGATITIDCVASYAAQRGPDAADAALATARAALDAAQNAGFDTLATEQNAWFDAFWADAAISFPDSPVAEQALRHGLFQLVQAVGRDGATSIAAKGQTGEGYEGHVFWDADSYVLPVFVHTRPEIARAMLAWRISGLDAARANARAMGQQRGALYPWRTIGGGECSSFFPAGSAQYHINADIGHALKLYVEASGDRTILAEGGAEMLAETARIWLEIGYHDPARDDAFVINRVTGPDEYSALVDNNLYTNLLAAEHLRFAVAEARALLSDDEAARMIRAAETMFLPFDEERQIPAQDDGFFGKQPWPFETTPDSDYPLLIHYHPLTIYRHRVAKQADAVLAIVLLREAFDRETRRAMLSAYEAVTVHDSTLSASVFAAAAAGIGDADRAAHYWRVSALTDLSNLFANSDHGLHMAALAGAWNALVMGFGGMRSHDGRLSFEPIAVPSLGRYSFAVRYRGRRVMVEVDGTEARYRIDTGAALTIFHNDVPVDLLPGVTSPVALIR
ncbi:trehalose/maltose hydrolase-like predicted phosphorylase [Sphingomonas sp. UYAg733]